MSTRRIVFGRINRRYQQSFGQESFPEEMTRLANLGRFEAHDGEKHWLVGDIDIDGTLLAGVIGFMDPETRVHFDEDADSWIKAVSEPVSGASVKAVVPFAIDLRPEGRWTANVTSQRVHAQTFRKGIEMALNEARRQEGWPTNWEVDLVTSTQTALKWVVENPNIRRIERTIKLPNPVPDLSNDIERMKRLGARRKKEVYTAGYNQNLRAVDAAGDAVDDLEELFKGLDVGQIELKMQARINGTTVEFSSNQSVDTDSIDDFGDDLQLGIEWVRDALRAYARRRES